MYEVPSLYIGRNPKRYYSLQTDTRQASVFLIIL